MKHLFLVIVVLAFVSTGYGQNSKYGSLAIDKSDGFYYGWAYDNASLAGAESRAVDECNKKGGNCSAVLSWSGMGCAAYRTISGKVGTAYGWGIAADKLAADAIATAQALKNSGGASPSDFVWACNSQSTEGLKIIRNETQEPGNKLTGLKDQDEDVFDYEGEIRNNLPHGFGIATYRKGDMFTGNYIAGIKTGKGKYTWKSGGSYEGDYKSEKMDGKGIYQFPSGRRYEGDFKNDKMHGYGKFFEIGGGYYEGDYENGLMHGQGKYVDAGGKTIFEGRMENDNPVAK